MQWSSFENVDGSNPPEAVLHVYRYFQLLALWPIVIGVLLIMLIGGFVISKILMPPIKVTSNLGDLYFFLQAGAVLLITSLILWGIAISIRLKIAAVYYLLYSISKLYQSDWLYIGSFWPKQQILDAEFRRWFIREYPTGVQE